MKPLAVFVLIVAVYLAFPARFASAQCNDYAGCAGQRADANAKLGAWARETAVAIAEERRAAATERAYERMVALTATEAARPTKTPVPTVTAWPTATSLPSATPQPAQIIVQVVVTQTQQPVNIQPETRAKSNTAGYIVVFGSLALIVAGIYILFRGRTVFYPHEPS